MPGAPGELRLGDLARGIGASQRGGGTLVVNIVGGVRLDLPGCAAPKEQAAGDEVGGVETGGGEGDYIFEDSGGADVN